MKIKPFVLLVCVLISLPCVSTAEQSSEYQRQLALSEQTAAAMKAQSEKTAAAMKAQSEKTAAAMKAQSEKTTAAMKAQSEKTTAAMKAQSEQTAAWFKAQSEKTAAWFKTQSEKTNAWFKTQSEKTNAWFKTVADYMNMNVTDPLQPRNIAPDVGTQAISQGVTSGIPGAGEIVDISNAGADLIKPWTLIRAVSYWNNEFGEPFIPPDWPSTHIPQMIALDKELTQLQTKLGDGKSLNPMNQRISPDNLEQYRDIVNKYVLRK